MKKLSTSDITFFGLISIMFIGKLVWSFFRLDHPLVQQSLNSWGVMIAGSILGFISLKLAAGIDLPDIWDKSVSNKQRFLVPVLLGFGFAIIQIFNAILMEIPNINVEFPLSIPVYLSVGILSEIIFHLVPLILLVWLIYNVILKRKFKKQVFWIVAILICLWEPLLQVSAIYQMGIITNILFFCGLFIFIFAGNLIPVYFIMEYGFLAAIMWRLSFYMIWHIIWPIIYY